MDDFFAKKIKTLYERFDMDKNGLIEEDDFDRWSEKLIAIGLWPSFNFIFLSL